MPTSPVNGFPPRSCSSPPAPTAATSATCSATSCRYSDGSACAGYGHHYIEALYDQLLSPTSERPALAPKTVYEIHLVIRGCLADAVRRGLLSRNVALLARSPRLKAIPRTEAQSWTDAQLRQFLRTAAGHRLFPLLWLTAMTGMRRNEVLGLKWGDIDFEKRRLGLNRGLVAIGYDLHQTRGMQAEAARTYQRLTAPVPKGPADPVERRRNSRKNTTDSR